MKGSEPQTLGRIQRSVVYVRKYKIAFAHRVQQSAGWDQEMVPAGRESGRGWKQVIIAPSRGHLLQHFSFLLVASNVLSVDAFV